MYFNDEESREPEQHSEETEELSEWHELLKESERERAEDMNNEAVKRWW